MPAKAGIQLNLIWIPAFAGMTDYINMNVVAMPVDPLIHRSMRLAYRRGHGLLPSKTVAEVRAYFKQEFSVLTKTRDGFEAIDLPNQVRIHIFKSPSESPQPLLIYMRASGYVMGELEDTHALCHYLAQSLGCHVATIEPRLAPEVSFPHPFNDCLAAVKYLFETAAHHQMDKSRVIFWGESSGANKAAALSQILHYETEYRLKLQILFYPMVDYSKTRLYPSKDLYGYGYMMDNDLTDWFLNCYAPPQLTDRSDMRISPLLANDLSQLPPTLIMAAECDPMRDEAVAYHTKLIDHGVDARIVMFPGMIHGFLWYTAKHKTPQYAIQLAVEEIRKRI